MLLNEFLIERRDEVLQGAGELIRKLRPGPAAIDFARDQNLPAFLEAVIDAVRRRENLPSDPVPAPQRGGPPRSHEHWLDYDVDEVVYEYGSLCTTIVKVAERHGQLISPRQHQALNQALDENIAADVVAYEQKWRTGSTSQSNERLGFVAHELRNALHTAALSFQAIRSGRVPAQGVTGSVLERSHQRLRELVEGLLAQVRVGAGTVIRRERLMVLPLIEESVAFVAADARAKNISISIDVDPALETRGDPTLLASALTNLVQNGVKFTPAGKVAVRALRVQDGARVLIEVEDECGGLAPAAGETIFEPFVQVGEDRSGLGLGLSIAREIVAAHGGALSVRDFPGRGCVFVMDLPSTPDAPPASP
ncbi:MAG TPA: HAMP domain-containing sensor histidine kinase [Myxococcales bacterium]|nr:HAMP domain-containing sensor histidine kinase [Myxococcales bacterium]